MSWSISQVLLVSNDLVSVVLTDREQFVSYYVQP